MMSSSHNKSSEQKTLMRLISELPADTWLEIDKVVSWLKTKAGHDLAGLSWRSLFTQRQAANLHHLNKSGRYIYLPPLFYSVIKNKLPSLPSPGWLEICYQKQRNCKSKQSMARIERNFSDGSYNFYGLEICVVRRTKQGYSLQKDSILLESKHIIRLRMLDTIEITTTGLHKLS